MNESIRIVNSDPKIIKVMVRWFEEICNLKKENFNPSIHIYPDNNIKKSLNYWSRITGAPKKQFGKTQIDKRMNKSFKKKRRLLYGTLHLQIRSRGNKEFGKRLHRHIMGWLESCLDQVNNAGVV